MASKNSSEEPESFSWNIRYTDSDGIEKTEAFENSAEGSSDMAQLVDALFDDASSELPENESPDPGSDVNSEPLEGQQIRLITAVWASEGDKLEASLAAGLAGGQLKAFDELWDELEESFSDDSSAQEENFLGDYVTRVLAETAETPSEESVKARGAFQGNLLFLEFALSFPDTLSATSADPTFEHPNNGFIQEVKALLRAPEGWVTTLNTPTNHILITSPKGEATVSLFVIERQGVQSCLIHTYEGVVDEDSYLTLYTPPAIELTVVAVVKVVQDFFVNYGA